MKVLHKSHKVVGPYLAFGGKVRRLRFPFLRKHHYRIFLTIGRRRHQWDFVGKDSAARGDGAE